MHSPINVFKCLHLETLDFTLKNSIHKRNRDVKLQNFDNGTIDHAWHCYYINDVLK